MMYKRGGSYRWCTNAGEGQEVGKINEVQVQRGEWVWNINLTEDEGFIDAQQLVKFVDLRFRDTTGYLSIRMTWGEGRCIAQQNESC